MDDIFLLCLNNFKLFLIQCPYIRAKRFLIHLNHFDWVQDIYMMYQEGVYIHMHLT